MGGAAGVAGLQAAGAARRAAGGVSIGQRGEPATLTHDDATHHASEATASGHMVQVSALEGADWCAVRWRHSGMPGAIRPITAATHSPSACGSAGSYV